MQLGKILVRYKHLPSMIKWPNTCWIFLKCLFILHIKHTIEMKMHRIKELTPVRWIKIHSAEGDRRTDSNIALQWTVPFPVLSSGDWHLWSTDMRLLVVFWNVESIKKKVNMQLDSNYYSWSNFCFQYSVNRKNDIHLW